MFWEEAESRFFSWEQVDSQTTLNLALLKVKAGLHWAWWLQLFYPIAQSTYGGGKKENISFKAALFQVTLLLCDVEIDLPALIALDALGSGRLPRIYFCFSFTCLAVRLKRTEVCNRWCPSSRTGELLSAFSIRKMYKILWKPPTAASCCVTPPWISILCLC